jgi:hypothetical protein
MQRPITPDFTTHPTIFRRSEPNEVVNNPVKSIHGFIIPVVEDVYISPQTICSNGIRMDELPVPAVSSPPSRGNGRQPSILKKYVAKNKPRDEFGRFITN